MKRKKIWLRWIAWILLLVLCMNSAGTTALAVSANEESILNINGSLEKEMLSEEDLKKPSLRISFSHFNTQEDIDLLIEALKTV